MSSLAVRRVNVVWLGAAVIWMVWPARISLAEETPGFSIDVAPEFAFGALELNTRGYLATPGRTVYADRLECPVAAIGLAAGLAYTFVTRTRNFGIGPFLSLRYLAGFSSSAPIAEETVLSSPDGMLSVRLSEADLTGNLHLASASLGIEVLLWHLGLRVGYGLLRAEFFPQSSRETLLAHEAVFHAHVQARLPIGERSLAVLSAGYYNVLFDQTSLFRNQGLALISGGVEFDFPFAGEAP
jgi:hypothetical protein